MSPAEMAAIHAAAFPPAEAWDARAITELLAMPGCFATTDAQGFLLARVAADEAEVLTLAVHPVARRRGIARGLLTHGIVSVIKLGARTMWLEVAASNGPALALYQGFGFAESGRRRAYYASGEDALVLRLNIS